MLFRSKKEQERRIAEQKYQQNLVEYQRELATYPARLAEWNQRNEIRKKRLADAHLQAKENTVVLKKQEDELQQRVKDREEEVEKANREIKSIRSKLQSFDSLLAQRKEGDRFKGIYRPSLFQSVDWSAEADRLLKELR